MINSPDSWVSPEDAAPIKAGLRRRVVTVSEGTRSKGIHWRRGLCVLQTGRGLLVSLVSVLPVCVRRLIIGREQGRLKSHKGHHRYLFHPVCVSPVVR
ncbi:hypothetical protein KUCAC02_005520 [Chaenocephalus aceratus]|uniref:Uncharacterized protein n=1 Tax=Chaenocephalus aceratus TaxID=36190 RepID=A0ACB9WQ94_CHAAC|nr:hypothetical protein KUCAC02_005520 [Chaenocephalus aceratus]